MRFLETLFFTALSLPLTALACPIGMQPHGSHCYPVYSGWDMLRDRRAAIDAMGSNHRPSGPPLTAEQARKLNKDMKQLEKEKEEKRNALAKGFWKFDSAPTPEGQLCAAVFTKFTSYEGGLVTIMGVKNPTSAAWVIFHGARLPKSKDAKTINITFQQGNDPAQTVPAINYRESREVGTIILTVAGLSALVDGMLDKQRLRLSDDGKMLLDIEWDSAAPVIEKLKQCAK